MVQGFKINRYNPCVANKVIDGDQCTIYWYVDDTKISHKKAEVVGTVLESLEKKFGKTSIKRGKKHTFVGMDVEYTKDNKVRITMDDYLSECISTFGEHKLKTRRTPGAHDLFEIDEKSPQLDNDALELFHHNVAKLLFVAKRARLDIEPTILFLCTRLSKSTE